MRRRARLCALLALLAGPLAAEAPEQAVRPEPRPAPEAPARPVNRPAVTPAGAPEEAASPSAPVEANRERAPTGSGSEEPPTTVQGAEAPAAVARAGAPEDGGSGAGGPARASAEAAPRAAVGEPRVVGVEAAAMGSAEGTGGPLAFTLPAAPPPVSRAASRPSAWPSGAAEDGVGVPAAQSFGITADAPQTERHFAGLPGRPAPRPERAASQPPDRAPPAPASYPLPATGGTVARALRPPERPGAITAAAVALVDELARGAVCGSTEIQGETVGRVSGAGACGIDEAVRVRSVAGVQLSTPALLDCRTAQALNDWVSRVARPAVGTAGGGLDGLRVVAHYGCRGLNNRPGARLSQHAFGRAIDISGLRLRDGRLMTVLHGWNTERDGPRLEAMHRGACGIFGTVLGPEANRYHLDHFHFDTARNRSRSYCR